MGWHKCSICCAPYKGDRSTHHCDTVGFFLGVNRAGKRWECAMRSGRVKSQGARFRNLCLRFSERNDMNELGLRCAFILGGTLAELRTLVWREEHVSERNNFYAAVRALGLDGVGHNLSTRALQSEEPRSE